MLAVYSLSPAVQRFFSLARQIVRDFLSGPIRMKQGCSYFGRKNKRSFFKSSSHFLIKDGSVLTYQKCNVLFLLTNDLVSSVFFLLRKFLHIWERM